MKLHATHYAGCLFCGQLTEHPQACAPSCCHFCGGPVFPSAIVVLELQAPPVASHAPGQLAELRTAGRA